MIGEAISSPCLSARGIWKVFGNRPKRALEMADTGASRAEVREATGCIIGARDVSFDAYHRRDLRDHGTFWFGKIDSAAVRGSSLGSVTGLGDPRR